MIAWILLAQCQRHNNFFYLEAKSCVDGPFLNGGHCIDNIPIPGFTCNCPYTYHGIICEKGK